ncbi:immunity protein YezG family protein [Acinetobacter baumannii]|uniref:DUF600 family protein n=1 Tax=Acinetobacter baumannii TaxID=470 RepID=A0A9P2P3T7_ACIBA|nr:immunity protein YezG family protein [Acinetobacter baumannii]EKT7960262.1 hypothetical protein [Acinetobacter baumannii]EKT9125462.1 hypothetical protein [Acinetobacter baumannii]EKT9272452.1 hypothetical protein [Acinetobacter baumannii]EKT9313161.1 hypothetical protein [Acinetobacter baumannii]EKU0108192.1 hypothetical protein [Acinetobacter baumannii]
MNEQEIYQKIGELLWSIMPQDAQIITFIGKIYPEYQGWGTSFILKNGKLSTFDFGEEPADIELQIKDLANNLRNLDIFKEKWTHYKITLTDTGKFNIDFAYIPEEDSWVSLYMKGISDLNEEELDKDYPQIPKELWKECIKMKEKNKK